MITENQILEMVDLFEKRVQAIDSSMSVRLQQAQGLHGIVYIVHCENATTSDKYEVDANNGTWIRVITIPE